MHELSHGILGMGDAYEIDGFPHETIMQSAGVEPILTGLDMKNLAIKYLECEKIYQLSNIML